MLRERTFFAGGAIVIAVGLALGVGLALSGAGISYASAWLASGIAVGLGVFFLYVGREAQAYRRTWMREVEAGRPPPPGGPPS